MVCHNRAIGPERHTVCCKVHPIGSAATYLTAIEFTCCMHIVPFSVDDGHTSRTVLSLACRASHESLCNAPTMLCYGSVCAVGRVLRPVPLLPVCYSSSCYPTMLQIVLQQSTHVGDTWLVCTCTLYFARPACAFPSAVLSPTQIHMSICWYLAGATSTAVANTFAAHFQCFNCKA